MFTDTRRFPVRWFVLVPLVMATNLQGQAPIDVKPLLEKIRQVEAGGQGHEAAMAAWPQLAAAPATQIPDVLAGMDSANPLVVNWIRSAVETIAQRQLDRGGQLPVDQLERFLNDRAHHPRARRLAYELIVRVRPESEARLIGGLLNDPSSELRYDAVAWTMEQADQRLEQGQRDAALADYRRAFSAAREVEQVKALAEKLKSLGVTVDLPRHFGFVMKWKVIGPFDNTDGVGLDRPYPPEREIDFDAQYVGKIGRVRWFDVVTEDRFGVVDLNKAFERPAKPGGNGYQDTPESLRRCKGSVAYACAEFYSDEKRDVEIRLGCITAHQVWLNGKVVIENQVWHAGMAVDQYVGQGTLRPGRNVILVKAIQNEQSESWAQRWCFQLRVCDQYGTAVLSTDRAGPSDEVALRDR